jgi:hypothetical protein
MVTSLDPKIGVPCLSFLADRRKFRCDRGQRIAFRFQDRYVR